MCARARAHTRYFQSFPPSCFLFGFLFSIFACLLMGPQVKWFGCCCGLVVLCFVVIVISSARIIMYHVGAAVQPCLYGAHIIHRFYICLRFECACACCLHYTHTPSRHCVWENLVSPNGTGFKSLCVIMCTEKQRLASFSPQKYLLFFFFFWSNNSKNQKKIRNNCATYRKLKAFDWWYLNRIISEQFEVKEDEIKQKQQIVCEHRRTVPIHSMCPRKLLFFISDKRT